MLLARVELVTHLFILSGRCSLVRLAGLSGSITVFLCVWPGQVVRLCLCLALAFLVGNVVFSFSPSLFICLFPCLLVVVVRPLSVILPVGVFLTQWWEFVAAAVLTGRLRVDTLGVPMDLEGIVVPNGTFRWFYSVPDS